MKSFKAVVLLLVASGVECTAWGDSDRAQSITTPFYRRDYTYLDKYNAFYKLHQEAINWLAAFETCDGEGAQLFYPSSEDEAEVLPDLAVASGKNVNNIFLGFRDDFGLGEFMTIHGKPIPFSIDVHSNENSLESESSCIYMNTSMNYSKSSCNHKHSFICKRIIEASKCPTIDRAYIYIAETGRCYKVNKDERTWRDALATCYNEGAFLLTLDNGIEATALKGLFKLSEQYYLGIRRAPRGNHFFTVKGSRNILSEISWGPIFRNESDYCVVMTGHLEKINSGPNNIVYNNDGTEQYIRAPVDYNNHIDNEQERNGDNDASVTFGYSAVDCGNVHPFICEMDARP